MRAVYLSDLEVQNEYLISGDHFHHVVNVARARIGDEILLLNGKGLRVLSRVSAIAKSAAKLVYISHKVIQRKLELDLALGIPKRDALDLSLKMVTEIGFRKVYLVHSGFSQMNVPELPRIERLLISALEQANADFLPEVVESSWEKIPWHNYKTSILFDSQNQRQDLNHNIEKNAVCLLILGPEGGFTEEEFRFFLDLKSLSIVNLPTPIMRTPTAVATCAGYVIHSLLN